MDTNDIKLLFLNTGTIAVSFSAVEDTLKLVLLILSIAYTVQRMTALYSKKKED
jgi:hypothetical protein